MSFREKSAWISLLSMTGIYGFYFWSVIHTGPHTSSLRFGGLLSTIVTLVIVQVVLTTAVAIFRPSEAKAPRDERDKLIELRAMRVAYAGLATSIAHSHCFFRAPSTPPIVFNTNALLFILVTKPRSCGLPAKSSNTGGVPDMGRIRNEIRRLRFEHGEMTQQELAEKINLTRQTVNAIEQGKYSPSLEAAFRISAVFGRPLESVFHYSQEE